MKINIKDKFKFFFIFNIVLLIILILLSFPLYKLFVRITDYNSIIRLPDNSYAKDSVVSESIDNFSKIINRTMKINFIAEVDSSLNWQFKALQEKIEIKVGESIVIKFQGKNLSDKKITGTANFYAKPEKILPYIIKTECFCFIEQTLNPNESQIFSLIFFLDSSLDQDPSLNGLDELVLTYRFSQINS